MAVSERAVPVLERTLATTFEPGTNRPGGLPEVSWTLLLDRLELGHVTCLGQPRRRVLRALQRRARAVTIVTADAPSCHRARRRLASAGFGSIGVVPIARVGELPDADLAVVVGRRWLRRAAADGGLGALLSASGAVYAESGRPGRAEAVALPTTRPAVRLWLWVVDGDVRLAAGLNDDAAVAFLRRPPAAQPIAHLRPRPGELVRRVRRHPRAGERIGVLSVATRCAAGLGAPVPGYLRGLAAAAGERLDDCRVALAAPGDYPSRKAILAVFPPDGSEPRYIVKIARDPAYNGRLENEDRALRALAAAGIGDAATVPRASFSGHDGGLAVLAQTAISGVPFRQVARSTHECPSARAAIAWLMELGARTADRTIAEPAQAAAALRVLLDRFAGLYRPSVAEHDLLAEQIDVIAASRRPFPLVFQHGDPGVWNLLITPDGRPAFLDWEAAEQHGMPLWDLFYAARSVGIGVARASGTRSSLDAFAEQYLADGPMSRALADDVGRHCTQIDLDPVLVGPLFFTCWMHRALKEAARLEPHGLANGRYARLLRLCLQRRDAPGLTRLCGAAAG
jgi:Phosphotransferase enzyme family